MRLLVISFAFPPYNSIGGVRVGKTVKYLSQFGHDIRVLTARDQPFRPTLPVEFPEQQITYSKWLTLRRVAPQGTVEPSNASTGNSNSPASGKLKSTLKKALGYPYRTLLNFPDSNIGWLPYAVADASRLLEKWKPELIFASSPPPTSLLVAHRLSKKFNVPWVADLRDLWIDHPYYEQPGWRKVLEEKLERRVLSSAAGLVTVSEPLAQILKKKYGTEAAVILNGFDAPDYPSKRETPLDKNKLRILYTGMIYPGKRDPSPLFEALLKMGALAEKVRVVFHGFFLESAKELAKKYGVEHLVEVNGSVTYAESLKMQTEADILLLLLWSDATERGVYTGKLFEYIGARRPILAVGGVNSVAADMIRERSLGAALDDPAQIAAQLEEWVKQKQETGRIPALPDEAVAGVSREEQTRILEDYFFRLLGARGQSSVDLIQAGD
jgi:glycosyltransferase involved in cell wall biosynthesis